MPPHRIKSDPFSLPTARHAAHARTPRLGGREILGWIGRERPDLPVVLSSGYDERAAELQAPDSPVRAFLPKPYLPSELVSCIRDLQDGPTAAAVPASV